ncbi:MAG: hypothetical protein IKR50_07765 [Prevotella sp.]|nr:hypothetical protein [Prevotella sp.]
MGIYIDKGNGAFSRTRNSEYIDKSGLIAVVNKTLFTEQSYTCEENRSKNVSTPAIIVELKYNDTTDTAIDQIHRRNYPKKVAEYTGDILLVAVSYDRKTKEHHCEIERWSSGENRPC